MGAPQASAEGRSGRGPVPRRPSSVLREPEEAETLSVPNAKLDDVPRFDRAFTPRSRVGTEIDRPNLNRQPGRTIELDARLQADPNDFFGGACPVIQRVHGPQGVPVATP